MGFSPSLYLLAGITFFLDLIDVLVRLYLRQEHSWTSSTSKVAPTSVPLDIGEFTEYESRLHLRPYAIVASVHNAAHDLEAFVSHLDRYRRHLWIIDDASTDRTWERLESMGVHAVRGITNQKKPGALKTLLAEVPTGIETIVVLDPDSRILTSAVEFERALLDRKSVV